MNLPVWSRPEGGNFPLLQEEHHTWARKSLGQGVECCSSAHVQGTRECHSLWAPPWAAVLETCWGRQGRPPTSGTSRGSSSRQSREAWCHGTTWTTLSHGHCLDYCIVHLSQANLYTEVEVRKTSQVHGLLLVSPSQVLSCCSLPALVNSSTKAETSWLLYIYCSPQEVGARLIYSSPWGISTVQS